MPWSSTSTPLTGGMLEEEKQLKRKKSSLYWRLVREVVCNKRGIEDVMGRARLFVFEV